MNGAMLLTDIALHLLGNTIYNTNGEPVDNLTCLYKFNQAEHRINRDKKHLKEVLGIYEENGHLKACSDQSSSENSDDEVIPIEPPQEIVDLVDDDDDSGNEATSTSDRRGRIEPTSKLQGQPTPSQPLNDYEELESSDEDAMQIDTGSSSDENDEEKSVPANSPAYHSPNQEVRLDFFKKAVKLEREKILKASEQKKVHYLTTHRQRSKIITDEKLVQMFRVHQRDELYDEMRHLMQFIRIIKHTDKDNHEMISEIGKDILAAKNVNQNLGAD